MARNDPVKEAAEEGEDLYDVATWENRSVIDGLAVRLHEGLRSGWRRLLIVLAVLVLVAQLGGVLYALTVNPTLGALTLLSVIPAFLLVGFIWWKDATMREPWAALAVTFLLSVLFASFAAAVNSVLKGAFELVPVVGTALYFFLVVGPVEETVKWLAVRTYAFRTDHFDAVVDGAVYGAVAGLGFATIENLLYITQEVFRAVSTAGTEPFRAALGTATSRAFVGPGHVIYSAWAGYYLGLAKFNPDDAGPIVVKGLLVAVVIHATYNTIVTFVSLSGAAFFGFILVYDGTFIYLLYRKLSAYRKRYRSATDRSAA
jgi:RsiW-degrading membrane proteinase PrsW (M82 family)